MAQRMGRAEQMRARPLFGQRLETKRIVADLDTTQIAVQGAAQIGVEHEFFVGHRQQPVEKPRRMQHVIGPALHG